MNLLQNFLFAAEVGKGRSVVWLFPLVIVVGVVAMFFDYVNFTGLSDPQSMDNAQVARQIYRGQGFTTQFLRPFAVAQLRDYAAARAQKNGGSGDLFPADRFPAGVPRILPDTYNAPGFPYLLALWFHVVHPEFDQTPQEMGATRVYSGDRWIPYLNAGFVLLTAVLVFALAFRLFDERVAWLALISFLFADVVWRFSITGLSTTFLMFLVTAIIFCAVEIFRIGDQAFKSETSSFWPAWIWTIILGLLLALGCLTRYNLLVLIAPLFVLLMVMPRATIGLPLVIIVLTLLAVGPWFYHMKKLSGSSLGSNEPLILLGQGEYSGNQIYCTTSIPSYELIFKNAVHKEYLGFHYNFQHAWNLLGGCPMVLFFATSIMHKFRRKRVWFFNWFLFGCAFVLVAANSLGSDSPDQVGPWNILPLLLPSMIVMGTAFFFLLLDRLDIEIDLIRKIIITAVVVITLRPLLFTMLGVTPVAAPFPPYVPPLIKVIDSYVEPNEWATSDIPWASAWYGDRPSLWLPDSIKDFDDMHDTLVPTGILFLTPQTWMTPVQTFRRGEYKDWASLVFGLPLPPTFPLVEHTPSAEGPDYGLWSDRPRWQQSAH